ncbi:hypothetical protein ACW95P_03615 [Candidatus Mycoplasma pogonae]
MFILLISIYYLEVNVKQLYSNIEINVELMYFLLALISCMVLESIIFIFVLFISKKKFEKNQNKIIHITYQDFTNFDLAKYNYDINQLEYLTIFRNYKNAKKSFLLFIKTVAWTPKQKRTKKIAFSLVKIMTSKINFEFENDKDRACWLYNALFNECVKQGILSPIEIEQNFLELTDKYRIG